MYVHSAHPLTQARGFPKGCDSIVGRSLVNGPIGVSKATSWFISTSQWSARSSLLVWDVKESTREEGPEVF